MTYFDAKEVKALVRSAGMNMGEFFAFAGVHKSTWHRWILGETSPNVETLQRLQSALDRLARRRVKRSN